MGAGTRRSGIVRSLVKIVFASLLVLGAFVVPSSAYEGTGLPEDPRLPGQGIPDYSKSDDPKARSGSAWTVPQNRSLSYLPRAKQWVRTGRLQTVTFKYETDKYQARSCNRPLEGGWDHYNNIHAEIFLVDTDTADSDPGRFGRTPVFTTRAAAFGSVPVEVGVRLVQPRDGNGVVMPLMLDGRGGTYCPGEGPFPDRPDEPWRPSSQNLQADTHVDGQVRVELAFVRVDGVNLQLRAGCAAGDLTEFNLTGKGYNQWDPDFTKSQIPVDENLMSTPLFKTSTGGLLTGKIDIPAFENCVTADGEDVSALVTSAAAGPDNVARVRSEGLAATLEPGDGCPWEGSCDVKKLKQQYAIPDHPPKDQE